MKENNRQSSRYCGPRPRSCATFSSVCSGHLVESNGCIDATRQVYTEAKTFVGRLNQKEGPQGSSRQRDEQGSSRWKGGAEERRKSDPDALGPIHFSSYSPGPSYATNQLLYKQVFFLSKNARHVFPNFLEKGVINFRSQLKRDVAFLDSFRRDGPLSNFFYSIYVVNTMYYINFFLLLLFLFLLFSHYTVTAKNIKLQRSVKYKFLHKLIFIVKCLFLSFRFVFFRNTPQSMERTVPFDTEDRFSTKG